MPEIPVSSPLSYVGIFLVLFGFFLALAGLGIIKIEKITVTPGTKTWVFGFILVLLGAVVMTLDILQPLYIESAANVTPIPATGTTSSANVAPVPATSTASSANVTSIPATGTTFTSPTQAWTPEPHPNNNLLMNSGFEDPLDNAWRTKRNASRETPGQIGNYQVCSTQIEGTDGDTWAGITQRVPINSNHIYMFYAWLYWENAAQVHMKVDWLDPNGELIKYNQPLPGTDGNSEIWSKYGGEVISPANAKYAEISILHGVGHGEIVPGGLLCVDEVEFIPIFELNDQALITNGNQELLNQNIVKNSGFEDGLENLEWIIDGDADRVTPGKVGDWMLCSTQVPQGITRNWAGIRQYVQVAPLVDYEFRAWLMRENVVQAHMKIGWLDGKGDPIGEDIVIPGLDGSSEGWELKVNRVKSPGNALNAQLYIWHGKKAGLVVEGGKLCIDQVEFIQMSE